MTKIVDSEIYPFEDHYLDLDGLKYHYIDEGPRDGEAVVMVHGNPSWSFYYRELVKALRSDYRVIVPDHIGCGMSDKPSDDLYEYSLERRVIDLEKLIDHAKLPKKFTLVVHDWGGMIGMVYATRHKDRIARLVVMNTSAFHLPKTKSMPMSLLLARGWLGALLVRGFNAFSRGANRYCVTRRPMAPEVAAAYLAPYDSWQNRIAVHRFVQDIPLKPGDRGYDLVSRVESELDQLRAIPKLIFWGQRDFVFDDHFLEGWVQRCPEAVVHRYPDCGHYVLEDNHEEIIPLIEEFLSRAAPADHPEALSETAS
jgi:cis-3-alkyl-4-acyloxetan-2-one decarboxylase